VASSITFRSVCPATEREESLSRNRNPSEAAATNLVAKGLISREPFLSGIAALVPDSIPAKLLAEVENANSEESMFMDFLVNQFGALDLIGLRGLRSLTGLVRRHSLISTAALTRRSMTATLCFRDWAAKGARP